MPYNDIIEAKGYFRHIVYSDGFSPLEKDYAKAALMAFERVEQQRKDIDFLRERADVCFVCVKQEENDRLRKELKTAKTDAIREFDARFREIFTDLLLKTDLVLIRGKEMEEFAGNVDNLVKEMTEGQL